MKNSTPLSGKIGNLLSKSREHTTHLVVIKINLNHVVFLFGINTFIIAIQGANAICRYRS